jgi:hypothetical protein
MVVLVNPNPNNRRLDLVKISWSTSLRNSFRRRRVIEDSSPKKGEKESRDDSISLKEVTFDDDHLVTVIPENSEPVTDEEMTKCWCQVSNGFAAADTIAILFSYIVFLLAKA